MLLLPDCQAQLCRTKFFVFYKYSVCFQFCFSRGCNPLSCLGFCLCRNVTVLGAAGNSTANPDALPVLDMNNRIGILQLCSSCTFSLQQLALANENPTGTGNGMAVFWGQHGSRVDWIDGVGWRIACPPARPQLPLISQLQRSTLFPGNKQLVELLNITYKVRLPSSDEGSLY